MYSDNGAAHQAVAIFALNNVTNSRASRFRSRSASTADNGHVS
jgi:hypothetical protein